MEEKKKSYGQISRETLENNTFDDNVIEYRRKMEPGVMKDIWGVIIQAKSHLLYANRDFYIVATISPVQLADNQPLWKIWARRSCPTPVYNQNVWKYHHKSASLEYLWTIPHRGTYYFLLKNYNKLSKEEKWAADFCSAMESGALLQWVIKENGEKADAVIKLNQEIVHV